MIASDEFSQKLTGKSLPKILAERVTNPLTLMDLTNQILARVNLSQDPIYQEIALTAADKVSHLDRLGKLSLSESLTL